MHAEAPGKLFVAGEYAVVEPGEPAILFAVNKNIRVEIQHSPIFDRSAMSPHVLAACDLIEEMREHRGITTKPFALTIHSELENEHGVKFGLGSSAAVTVATIDVLNQWYGFGLSLTERYRMALLATLTLSPRASGGDVAASTFGGWVWYRSPDRAAVMETFRSEGLRSALASSAWLVGEILPIETSPDVHVLVGWTGSAASTDELVASMIHAEDAAQFDHETFLYESRQIVTQLAQALPKNPDKVLQLIREARALLQKLSSSTGTVIETSQLRTLCDLAEAHGAAAKSSGAGGGDCGIVLTKTLSKHANILRDWKQHGITDLHISAHVNKGNADEQR